METKSKKLAVVSYLTIVGWVIALILYLDQKQKNTLTRYHLRQGFGIILLTAGVVIITLLPVFGLFIGRILFLVLGILWLFGIIYALTGHEKPIPFIGRFFDEPFSFIK
jgi:uncharacterized membrane protein